MFYCRYGFNEITDTTFFLIQQNIQLIIIIDIFNTTNFKEPRGYPCQNLNIIFPSEMPGIDWGYIICEQECVYPLFSGHNTICVVTALLVSSTF